MVSGNFISASYSSLYEPVCSAPCDQVVDGRGGAEFFFGGKGVTNSLG